MEVDFWDSFQGFLCPCYVEEEKLSEVIKTSALKKLFWKDSFNKAIFTFVD